MKFITTKWNVVRGTGKSTDKTLTFESAHTFLKKTISIQTFTLPDFILYKISL
jgi:hypothetical protein